jgi:hypothetical protein
MAETVREARRTITIAREICLTMISP